MSDDDDKPEIDYLGMIDNYEPIRESLRGVVAMFVADGFTLEQARALAVTAETGYRFNSTNGESA